MFLVYIVSVLMWQGACSLSPSAINGTLRDIPDEGLMDFKQLAAKYGIPAEEHTVTTEDGYILTIFHIPGKQAYDPIVMSHGIFDTADGWLIRGNVSLAYQLAMKGHDLWLPTWRGGRYSRRHSSLNPDTDAAYWEYSSHELGIYDLAATIDYVLNATGKKQVIGVGFSQGTTIFFVLTSNRPEYNNKIKLFVGLAPVVFLQNTVGPLNIIINAWPLLNLLIPQFINEIAGYYSLQKAVINLLCTQLVIGYDLCYGGAVNPFIGPHLDSIDPNFFKTIVGHFPAGTSKKTLLHYAQIGMRGVFGAYDYGTVKNLQMYGSFMPPKYDLSKVRMPVALASGNNDRVSTLTDVRMLRDMLANVVDWKIMEQPLYNHLDLIWANDVDVYVNPYVMETIDKYNMKDVKSSVLINEEEINTSK